MTLPRLLAFLGELRFGLIMLGVTGAVVAFQIVAALWAARRRTRHPLPMKVHAVAGGAIAALPVALGIFVHGARAMAMRAMRGEGDPLDDAIALAAGVSAQTYALLLAAGALALALAVWLAGVAVTLRASRSVRRARSFPPAALVGIGLAPIAFGALRWAFDVVTPFDVLDTEPDENRRVALVTRSLETARAHFATAAAVSRAAIPILAIAAMFWILARARRRAGAGSPSPRTTLALAGAFIVGAALLVVEARPMARENDTPWPPHNNHGPLTATDLQTPDLIGPDAVEWAWTVRVLRDRLVVERDTVADPPALRAALERWHANHPSQFTGAALVLVDPQAPPARLQAVLQAMLDAQYDQPRFVFAKIETIERPVLGRLQRINATAARATLAYAGARSDADRDAIPLRPLDFASYEPFARRLVALRRDGKHVVVTIGRPVEAPPR